MKKGISDKLMERLVEGGLDIEAAAKAATILTEAPEGVSTAAREYVQLQKENSERQRVLYAIRVSD